MNPNTLAIVENIEITKQQMINVMRNLPREQASEVSTEAGRKKLLDEMIAGELLYLDGIENKLDQDEEFLQTMKEAQKGLLQRYAIQKLLTNIHVTTDEMEAYYDQNQHEFIKEEQVKASHILLADEAEAENVKQMIEDGLAFDEAAKQFSTCPSKDRGGDLGTFSRGQMVQAFEDVAFSQALLVVSNPVETQFGFHLIKVIEKTEKAQMALEEVANAVTEAVLQIKQGEVYEAKMKELMAKYHVECNEDALR